MRSIPIPDSPQSTGTLSQYLNALFQGNPYYPNQISAYYGYSHRGEQ